MFQCRSYFQKIDLVEWEDWKERSVWWLGLPEASAGKCIERPLKDFLITNLQSATIKIKRLFVHDIIRGTCCMISAQKILKKITRIQIKTIFMRDPDPAYRIRKTILSTEMGKNGTTSTNYVTTALNPRYMLCNVHCPLRYCNTSYSVWFSHSCD